MTFSLRGLLSRPAKKGTASEGTPRWSRFRPALEALEDRLTPALITSEILGLSSVLVPDAAGVFSTQTQVVLLGPPGSVNPGGPIGLIGPQGLLGQLGPIGPQGQIGLTGAQGLTGPGGVGAFGYIFNNSAETVAIEADIAFDLNGPLLGITHAPGTTGVVVTAAGTYSVQFSVSGVEPGQFALFVNGAEVAGSVYGSGAGTQQNDGQVILTLSASDVLTLRNHSSAAAVTLQTLAGGTQNNVNASLLILKIG